MRRITRTADKLHACRCNDGVKVKVNPAPKKLTPGQWTTLYYVYKDKRNRPLCTRDPNVETVVLSF